MASSTPTPHSLFAYSGGPTGVHWSFCLKPVIFFIPDHTSLILFCWSLYTSLLSLILTLSCFNKLLNNSPSPSLKALFFLLSRCFRSLVIQGSLLGKHLTIDIYSMWLAQCVPVSTLKATLQGFFSFV
ncbi:hypothetical protein ILYODFUR_020530 [Ilyodon furcidens]|uniref:Uncharacterized protein n=1 Tax=Ilyodon furcidens TaxID=33524 RepID=A0ABV0SYQ9_9TELE